MSVAKRTIEGQMPDENGNHPKERQPVTIKAECGNCAGWIFQKAQGPVVIGEARRGMCYGVPPTPAAVYDPKTFRLIGQKDLRAHPLETDTCLMFTPRQDLIPGGDTPN